MPNNATTLSQQFWTQQHLRVHSLEMATAQKKGEKGTANHEALDPWVHEWLTFLHTNYVLRHHKTLKHVIDITTALLF